jgi:hypothetical protein
VLLTGIVMRWPSTIPLTVAAMRPGPKEKPVAENSGSPPHTGESSAGRVAAVSVSCGAVTPCPKKENGAPATSSDVRSTKSAPLLKLRSPVSGTCVVTPPTAIVIREPAANVADQSEKPEIFTEFGAVGSQLCVETILDKVPEEHWVREQPAAEPQRTSGDLADVLDSRLAQPERALWRRDDRAHAPVSRAIGVRRGRSLIFRRTCAGSRVFLEGART